MNQITPAQELRQMKQTQTKVFMSVHATLKREIEEYLNRQSTINLFRLERKEKEVRSQIIRDILEEFLEFTEKLVLDQKRVDKVRNKEKITPEDLDYQYALVNLFNS